MVDSPQSDSGPSEVVRLVLELEELCARAERELVGLQWDGLVTTLADQRRVIAALDNVTYATAGRRPVALDEELERRVARIYAIRDGQLKRLVAFRDNVRGRLTTIARAKTMRRSFGGHQPAPSRLSNLDALR